VLLLDAIDLQKMKKGGALMFAVSSAAAEVCKAFYAGGSAKVNGRALRVV
jgi:hypothetical protein